MSRSGKLIITNDYLIEQLVADSDYDIRSDGTVWTLITRTGKRSVSGVWREAGTIDKLQGYRIIKYKNRNLNAHRIIYAKYGTDKLAHDLVINHIDNNRSNNHPSNLELVTQSQNNAHRYKTSAAVIGHKKIDQATADQIRHRHSEGAKYSQLCEEFGMCKSSISGIVNFKTWVKSPVG